MPDQSRAATMLAILKKQYEPEAKALERGHHAPIEGQEFTAFGRTGPLVKKRVDPDEWLKRKLAARGVAQESIMHPARNEIPVQGPIQRMQIEPLAQIKPVIKEQPIVQNIIIERKPILQPEIQKQPVAQPKEKKKLFGFLKKKVEPAKTVQISPEKQLPSKKKYIEPGMDAKPEEYIQAELQRQGELQKQLQQSQPAQKKSLRGSLYRKFVTEKIPQYPKFTIEQEKLSVMVPREEVKDHHVVYPLIKPFAYASIKWDPLENSMAYNVIEPELTDQDRHILAKLKEGLIQVINVSFEDIKNQSKMMDFLEESVRRLLYEYDFKVGEQQYMRLMYYIFRDFVGLNEIEPMLRDPYIEDIGADGVNIPVYIIHQRYGSLRTNIIYREEEKLKEFVTKLAERCDRYISYAEPLLDGTLPDGTRINASLSGDVTTRGPTFSVRKFRDTPFTPIDMVKMNTASPELLAYLWFVVQNRANILLTGGVSTGKTSFLNCLSLFIPAESKIVSIEDTRELALPHENWIPSVSRSGFTGTGVGEVTMFELLRESFRQNPDYLIVGEIRGKEAYVMFQAMASGHPSMSTMHAGSVDDVIKRLQTKPINLSAGLLEVLDVVIVMIHARDKGKSARRVKEVVELQNIDVESGKARVTKSFVWMPAIDNFEYRGDSWVLHKISKEKGIPMDTIMKEISQRKKLINWMVENNIIDLKEVVKYISLYYREPEKLKDVLER